METTITKTISRRTLNKVFEALNVRHFQARDFVAKNVTLDTVFTYDITIRHNEDKDAETLYNAVLNIATNQLCRCNKCGTVYIDNNPSDQPFFESDGYPELQYITRSDEDNFFWGCPKCMDDANLIDIRSKEML